jgi:hypothetical protein
MSFDPNDPNWRAMHGQPPISQYGFPIKPKPKSSNTWLYVLLGVGALAVLGCVGCAGVLFVTVSSGMQQASKELMAQVQPHPLIQQHIGQVQSMSMNFGESVALNEGKVGKKTAVFDIKGSQGSALIAGQVDDGHDRPARFQGTTVLILPSGESHELQF